MKVLFLTEGSSSIGFGHITRCLSLYQAFQKLGAESHMVVKGDESTRSVLKGFSYELFDWQEGWKGFKERLGEFNAVVVDSYLASKSIYEDISECPTTALYIDDYKRLDYPKGIVLNGSIYAEELSYPQREGIFYLLGTKYIPLRQAFWRLEGRRVRKSLKKVLITFGGDDSKNMTPEVIRFLRRHLPEIELHVVIGGGFKNREDIYRLSDGKVRLHERLSAEQMKTLMLEADLAISAGGQTTYELARTGTPAILVAVAENQLLNCEGWHKVGFAKYAGWWEDKELFERLGRYLQEFINYQERLRASRIGKSLVDGKGALRVVKFVLMAFRKGLSYPSL